MSIRQRIIQTLREHGVNNPAQAIRNWQQMMGYQIGQNDDAQAITGVILDTVDYAGATGRRTGTADSGVRAPIPTMTDTLLGGGGGAVAAAVAAGGATHQAVRNILRQHDIANPDAAIGIFMQSTGVQNFQGLDALQVAQAILGMQFPQRVAGRSPGPNAADAAEFGMSQDQYQLYLAAQLDRQQRQRLAKQTAQRQAAQRQAAAAASLVAGGGGEGAASAQQLTPAQRQFQQILKGDRWADKLTLQKLRQYVATRKSTLQKLLQDVKRDENVLNKVVVAMSYNR